MTSSMKRMIVTLAAVAGMLTAHAALAKNGGGGGGGNSHNSGNKPSGFKLNFVGNPQKSNPQKTTNFVNNMSKPNNFFKDNKKFDNKFDWKKSCYDGHCYSNYKCYSNYCYPYYGCYSSYCYPGYSCYSYPTCTYPLYSQTYEPIRTTCNITVIPAAPAPQMKVALGSILMLDGQAFGDSAGVARLQISGTTMPLEVLEWTGSAVKIRVPQFQLAGNTIADIEVLRADGSLATKTPVELMIGTPLALGQ